jgi:hypothetical protein
MLFGPTPHFNEVRIIRKAGHKVKPFRGFGELFDVDPGQLASPDAFAAWFSGSVISWNAPPSE